MRPKKRGHIERSQPQTRPPSSTPTLRLRPISIPCKPERGDADERARDDPERDEDHVGRVGRAVGHADVAQPPSAIRRVGPTRVSDVAALQRGRREHRHRRAGARDPAEIHAAREFVVREVGERAAVNLGARHHDVEHLGRERRAVPGRRLPRDAKPLLVDASRRAAPAGP